MSRPLRNLAFAVLLTGAPLLAAQCSSASDTPPVTAPPTSVATDAGVEASAQHDAATDRFRAARTEVDLRDDAPGAYQLHVLYVEPSDRVASPGLDEDGTLRRAVTSLNAWMKARASGAVFRIDTHDGLIDVTHVKLAVTENTLAQGVSMMPTGPGRIHERLANLLTPSFSDPKKMYLVYYDGLAIGTCGDSPVPSHMPMMYIGGIWSSSFLTGAAAIGATSIAAYDPAATKLPAAPFRATLGSETVQVTQIVGNTVQLQAALGQAHAEGELLKPENRPGDCRLNPYSSDGEEFTYAVFVGLHETVHALGMVAVGAPDYATPPVAGGHLNAQGQGGVSDLMYQGSLGGRCGDRVATAAASPCVLDPGHRNYFSLPAGSPLVDLAKSAFLEPSVVDAGPPPGW